MAAAKEQDKDPKKPSSVPPTDEAPLPAGEEPVARAEEAHGDEVETAPWAVGPPEMEAPSAGDQPPWVPSRPVQVRTEEMQGEPPPERTPVVGSRRIQSDQPWVPPRKEPWR